MKKTTIPRIYIFTFVALFLILPVMMIIVNRDNSSTVEAMALDGTKGAVLNERQMEVKEALKKCALSDSALSISTSAGDRVSKDENGYINFDAKYETAWANSSASMTVSGEAAARKAFSELKAYGVVKGEGYVATIYPVIESTYNGEKDVFENDTVVYYEITIAKQDKDGNTLESIRTIYNNQGLVSFSYYGT